MSNIAESKESGYYCIICQRAIHESELAYAEAGEAYHKECLEV